MDEVQPEAWFSEFTKYFLAPLLLFAEGKGALARATTLEHLKGVGLWILDNDPSRLAYLPRFSDYSMKTLENLALLVGELRFAGLGGEWDSYAQPSPDQELRKKDQQVADVLSRLNFSTAVDIGANRGLHSMMCESRGARVVSCDLEEGCANDLFAKAEKSSLDILPLRLDIVTAAGTGGAFNTQRSTADRLQCDAVLALALVHHVSFRKRFYPEILIETLAAYTSNIALIEFVPDDDWHVAQWGLPPLHNYSIDGFRSILSKHFSSIEDVPIEPDPRRLFVCQGKIKHT